VFPLLGHDRFLERDSRLDAVLLLLLLLFELGALFVTLAVDIGSVAPIE
jgi:hypothetical protein